MNQAEVASALKNVPLFQELDEPNLQVVARLTRHHTYPPNRALFHAGDSGHTLYVILSGRVRIEKISASGETIHLAYRGPGDHFGELSLLDDSPRMATVCTVTECECLTVERDAFRQCLLHAPAVALQVMVFLAKRLREAASDLEDVRAWTCWGGYARRCWNFPHKAGRPASALQITHQELADRSDPRKRHPRPRQPPKDRRHPDERTYPHPS